MTSQNQKNLEPKKYPNSFHYFEVVDINLHLYFIFSSYLIRENFVSPDIPTYPSKKNDYSTQVFGIILFQKKPPVFSLPFLAV
jgi:hypothetical protein